MAKKKGFELVKFQDLLPELEDVEYGDMLENLAEMENIEYPRIRSKRTPKEGFKFVIGSEEDPELVDEFTGVVLFY